MAINGLLGYVPYYSSDGVEVMRIPVISVSGTYLYVSWYHKNAISKLPGMVVKYSSKIIYGFVEELGKLHIKGTNELYFEEGDGYLHTTGENIHVNNYTFPVLIYRTAWGTYTPGKYHSSSDELLVYNSTSFDDSKFEIDIELLDEAEPPPTFTIDPTAFMQGWLVGKKIAGMRGKPKEET